MDGLFVEAFSWWFVEGLAKWFLFLSFWFVTPAVLPAAIVRRIAGPVSFVTALYTVALAAALVNWRLPVDWKFVPDRLPLLPQEEWNQELTDVAKKAAERPAGQPEQLSGLTHSKSLEVYTKWKEQYDKRKGRLQLATVIVMLLTIGLARVGRHLIDKQLPAVPPATDNQTAPEPRETPVVIATWLFVIATALDFIKWWFTRSAG